MNKLSPILIVRIEKITAELTDKVMKRRSQKKINTE